MRFLRAFLVLILVAGFGIVSASLVTATTPAGALSIAKTCPTGNAGTAGFSVMVPGAPLVSVDVPCGQTVVVPANAGFIVGVIATIHESTAPPGLGAAPDSTVTLTALPQTVTVPNGPGSPLSINKVCPAGVTGNASFQVNVPAAGPEISIVLVPCGGTATVPLLPSFVVGAVLNIHEQIAPPGAIPAADRTVTWTGNTQTVTITNIAAPANAAGTLTIAKNCPAGSPGIAGFTVTVSGAPAVTLNVTCGQSAIVPANAAFVVGASATIHESMVPPGLVGAPDQTVTLTAQAQTVTFSNAPGGPGPGASLQAQDSNIQAAFVATTVDAVAGSAPLNGVRQWQFALANFGNSPAGGATIAVHSNGPTLTNSAQFGFTGQVFAPISRQPGPPVSVPCTVSASNASCGPGALLPGNGQLIVLTALPGTFGTGVPISFTPGFDSQRQAGANGLWSVPVSLTDTSRYSHGGSIRVNLRGNFRSTGGQVTSNGNAVPPCSQPPGASACAESPQFQPGSPGSCGGGWFLAVDGAQLNATYVFSAQQATCASGKPVVDITASSHTGFSCCTTADSASISDADLGVITYTASPSTPANSLGTSTDKLVRLQYAGEAPACPPTCGGPGPGGNLQAQDTNIQAAFVAAAVDAVTSATQLNGVRQWQLGLMNVGTSPVTGGKIAVHSGGPTLTNSAQFGFSGQLFVPAAPGQPPAPSTAVPCTVTAADASCDLAGVPLPGNGQLGVFTGSGAAPGQQGPGVPISFMPGFDSQRQSGANGLWTVPVSLTDASRFGQGADIMVSLRGNFHSSGGQVMAGGNAVPQCSPGQQPGSATCAESPQFQPGGTGSCGGGWFFAVHGAELNTAYVFSAQQDTCAAGKPVVDIMATGHAGFSCCTQEDSAIITDSNLGSITYAAGPSTPPNSFGTSTDRQVHLRYEGEAPACPPDCGPPANAAGTVSILKTCPEGVSGKAGFRVRLLATGQLLPDAIFVPCGKTRALPDRPEFLVGAKIRILETDPPSGALSAPGQTITLSADAQTVTFADLKAAGTLTVTLACADGVSGTADFTMNLNGTIVPDFTISIKCGDSYPIEQLAPGDVVTLHEVAPPSGGVAASDQTVTVTLEPQTLTIANAAAVTVTTTATATPTATPTASTAQLATTGGGQLAAGRLAVLSLMTGWMVVSIGVVLLLRRRGS